MGFGAEESVWRGLNALDGGDQASACGWFGRASRLAPRDPHARLLLASTLAGDDDDAALKLLLQIIEENDLQEAHFGAAAIYLRRGEAAAAAAGLNALLQRFSPLSETSFGRVATEIAYDARAPGWIGLRQNGTLLVGLSGHHRANLVIRSGRYRMAVPDAPPRDGSDLIVTLPGGWETSGGVTATIDASPLLGSPLSPAHFRRAVGFVEAHEGGLQGWAMLPASPGSHVDLTVVSNASGKTPQSVQLCADAPSALVGPPRGAMVFFLARDALPAGGPLLVLAPNGEALTGSPVDPGAEMQAAAFAATGLRMTTPGSSPRQKLPGVCSAGPAKSKGYAQLDAWRPLPAELPLPRRPLHPIKSRGSPPEVVIVIPIYRGAAEFAACLASVRADLAAGARIIVVDDASPDAELRDSAAAAAAQGQVELLRLERNLGFPGAANSGLRQIAGRDAILLNSDTLVPPGWIERLWTTAWSSPDIGSVTPLSNDATILSYPDVRGVNAIPDLRATLQLDRACQVASPSGTVDLPTAVGFCMFLRHDCLSEVGLLREDAFAQGYGEENDWCLRARRLGWRHVAALDLFVAHVGGRSFGSAKAALTERNGRILNRLHPGYDALIKTFVTRDPIAAARRRTDEVRWVQDRRKAGAIVMISHGRGGGVDRHLRERAAEIAALGLRPILIEPAPDDENSDRRGMGSRCCVLSDGQPGVTDLPYPNLRFALPDELDVVVALLRAEPVRRVEIHHLLGHAPEIAGLSDRLGVPTTVHIHDYAWLCPRISLLGREGHHCSEPVPEACDTCVDGLGSPKNMPVDAAALRRNSGAIFARADRIIVSCQDVADRIRRHFPEVVPEIKPWAVVSNLTDVGSPMKLRPRSGAATIGIVGAIGPEKGFDVLLACARDAARRKLPLRFVLVGYSSDDDRLMRTGAAFVTGRFAEGEATELLHAHAAEFGFVPSVVPETWCYALSNLWGAGLRVAAFNLGAQAERIRAAGGGLLLPLGSAAAAINDALLAELRPMVEKTVLSCM